MSANTHRRKERYDTPRFTPTSGVEPVTETQLAEADSPEPATDGNDGVRLYAVARRDGVVHDAPGIDGIGGDAATILYVSADANYVVEDWHRRQPEGDWTGIPAAIARPQDAVEAAGENAQALAAEALPVHASQGRLDGEGA